MNMWQMAKGLFGRKPKPALGTALEDTPNYLVVADGEGGELFMSKPARGGIDVEVVDGKIDVKPIPPRFTARIRKDKAGRWRVSVHDIDKDGEAVLMHAGSGYTQWNDARRMAKALSHWGVEYAPELADDSVTDGKLAPSKE